MRKAAWSLGIAVAVLVSTATAAMADATYPPDPHHRVPPMPPTAFSGADISTPLKVLAALVIVGLLAVIAAVVFTKPAGER